jgi:hypothetical protein
VKWLIPLLLSIYPAMSDAQSDTSLDPAMQLTVKPVLCITDKRSPSCDMTFLVVWQSEQSGYYCLFNDFEETPLRCWVETHSGELSDERTVQNDFSYWMTDDDLQSLMAVVKIEVLRMDSDDRRRRRRTRHVWDIL